jgi:hypothetical protein
VTRRLIVAAVVCLALGLPAAAAGQQDTNPATTATTPRTTAPATTPTATAPATTPTATAPPATAPPAQTAPAPAAQPTVRSGNDRAAVLLLVMVGALLLLGLALWAVARWQAWDPPWLARWRHATGEAGWRAGNAWAEFTDWLRLGR